MNKVLLFLLLFFTAFAHAQVPTENQLIEITESVLIDASIEVVYAFAADTSNDHHWRSEVHEIISNGPFLEGTQYLEDARLGIHPHYFTKTVLIKKTPNHSAIYETTKDNKYFLRSSRFVETTLDGKMKFTYKVEFEYEMMKEILGIPWPASIGKAGYRTLMKVYLRKLKKELQDLS